MPPQPRFSDASHFGSVPETGAAACGSGDAVAPIEAGMRARAIADTCERWGLPVVLLDRLGRVLHIGPAAEALLGAGLTVSSGHLVGATPALNRVLERAVADAVGSGGPAGRRGTGRAGAALRMTGLRYDDPSPFQMLRGILVLGQDRADGDQLLALRRLLVA